MSAKGILGAMIAGSVAVVAYALLRSDPEPAPAPQSAPLEEPWLSREATEQIVGPDGVLGPLFGGLRPGGPAPSEEVRTRIATFARANRITIDIATADNHVKAIRFAVKYGGCCGYEGADKLGSRLVRPKPVRDTWVNDWATGTDGVVMRARIRVNRVEVRWERELTTAELLDRAERLAGVEVEPLRAADPDRWNVLESGKFYLAEMPYIFHRVDGLTIHPSLSQREDLGLMVAVEHGRIVHVLFTLRDLDEDAQKTIGVMLQDHWGRPTIERDDPNTWTWTLPDRVITAQRDELVTQIALEPRPVRR